MLQRVAGAAVCCSVLQHVFQCPEHSRIHMDADIHTVYMCVLQCVAVCCNVLHCVALCCSVLQCVAVCCSVLQHVLQCPEHSTIRMDTDIHTEYMCMLQCVAVCCSMLQCVAVCCGGLQSVVVCFSVL